MTQARFEFIGMVAVATWILGMFMGHMFTSKITQKECDTQVMDAEMECVRVLGKQIEQIRMDADLSCGKLIHGAVSGACPDVYQKLRREYEIDCSMWYEELIRQGITIKGENNEF